MAEFLSDPSVLTKDKLKSALVANNVALPNGEQRKGVYVELYLKNLTSQNKRSGSAEAFSSDEEPPAPTASITARSGRKATRKTDRVRPEEIDVTELTNEDLKDQLLKYGVNAGPIVASTRKVYEKKLQKLLDQGPPQTTIITTTSSEPVQTHNSRNGSADSDQYSDKEEETAAVPELALEPEPEPEPVPVVERPLRSRGKTPVTTRTRSGHHKEEDAESEEEDILLNVERKSRSSSRRPDHSLPDPVTSHLLVFCFLTAASSLVTCLSDSHVCSRVPFLGSCSGALITEPAIPRDPKPLIADTLPVFPSLESPDRRMSSLHTAVDRYDEAVSTDQSYKRVHVSVKTTEPHQTPSPSRTLEKKLRERAAALRKVSSEEVQPSVLDTALLEVGPCEVLSSRPGHVELKSASALKRTDSPRSASTRPSRDLIHMMCRLSPSPAAQGKHSPRSLSRADSPQRPARDLPVVKSSPAVKERSAGCAAAVQSRIDGYFSAVTPVWGQEDGLGDRTPGRLIEKLSAVEQTPKTAERDVLKELFPSEVLNTPTGISATRRQPIKGAAGRPFSDTWQDSLRPRVTEHRYTTSSYTESRSAPRLSSTPLSVPLSVPKTAAPPSVRAKTRRRVPVWVQLLLLAAVAGFLLFVYHTMESNQTSPFGQPSLETSGK
ncbi:thymopoietin a [Hemibagrus wyckioides]|uniref:thymopoietin a n=1 Tax=Hemibagrus wyckioides TaxID=337641 RepID=UPI00266C89E0|nr:thymopoietin a [Hemibagrus wyckioides]